MTSEEQAVQAVFKYAGGLMAAGVPDSEIEDRLARQGVPGDVARIVVRKLASVRDIPGEAAVRARDPGREMLVGGLICGVGLLVTLVSYASAASSPGGGTYVLAWGAIVFGAIRFFRGLAAAGS